MTNEDPTSTESGQQASGSNVVALPARQDEPAHRKVASFVHDHPFMTIAGGLAVGALAAALISKRNRKAIAKRSSIWAEAVTAATAALAQQAVAHAASASNTMRDQAGSLAHRAGDFGHAARERMETLGENSLARAQALIGRSPPEPTLAEKITAQAGKIRDKLHR